LSEQAPPPFVPITATPPKASSSSTSRLRVVGIAQTSFAIGDICITREGTDVPSDQVEDILAAARGAGADLEEVQ